MSVLVLMSLKVEMPHPSIETQRRCRQSGNRHEDFATYLFFLGRRSIRSHRILGWRRWIRRHGYGAGPGGWWLFVREREKINVIFTVKIKNLLFVIFNFSKVSSKHVCGNQEHKAEVQ